MHLVLDTRGMNIKVRKGCFLLQTGQIERSISPQKISSISITAQCWLSSSAIRLAVQHAIPMYFHDGLGNIEARIWSASFGHLASTRRKQICFGMTPDATAWVIGLFSLKNQEQIENLGFLKSRKTQQSRQIDEAIVKMKTIEAELSTFVHLTTSACAATLMGKEGAMARQYWQSISQCMPAEMQFDDRNRRPAKDPYNAATNYLYGILYGMVENALFLAGLDPYLGFVHADEYNQPALAFDMIEPFRPWADRLLIEAILKNEVKPDFFEPKDGGVWLSQRGKAFFIPGFNEFFEQKTVFRDKVISRKAQVYRIAQDLSKILTTFEYQP